jgi:hypothetical protein
MGDDEMTGSQLAELVGDRLAELLNQEPEDRQQVLMDYAERRLEEADLLRGSPERDSPENFAYQAITTNPRIPDYLNLNPINPESAETAKELIDNLAAQWHGE